MSTRRRPAHSFSFASTLASVGGPLVAIVLLTVVGGGLTLLLLSYTGWFASGTSGPSRAGLVAVPKSVRPIKAYTKIRREDIYDLRAGDESYYWMTPERVKANSDWLINPADIIGRVVATDKETGYVFSESNFLPKGTRPGIVGGIPAGKRSMVFTVDKTPGLELLSTGDQFDLLMSATKAGSGTSGSGVDYAALMGGVKPPELRVGQRAGAAGVRVVVQGGTLISMTAPPTPANSRTARTSTAKTATIALDPEEVVLLTQALGSDAKMFCIGRSGQPKDRDDAAQSIAGKLAIPALARPVVAYSKITQDDLADPATGRLNVYYFPEDRVSADWLREPEALIGRVVNRDLAPGHLMTSADLMPRGTRAGIAAGAPPGMRIYVAPISRIQGLAGLQTGDTVTLYGTLSSDVSAAHAQVDWAAIKGGMQEPASAELNREVRAGIRTVVRRAVIIRLDGEPSNVTFAIDPDEVTSLSQALNSAIEIFAVAASSQTDAEPLSADGGTASESAFHTLVNDARISDEVTLGDEIGRGDVIHYSSGDSGVAVTEAIVPAGNASDRRGQAPSDWLPYPVTARPVRAFEKLTIEDFIDPSTGRLRMFYFPPGKVSADWVDDLETLIDRVVHADIDSGRVLQKHDLLPVGSRSGPTAGIPPGWRSLTLTSLNVSGLENVREGDRLDLVETHRFGMSNISSISPDILVARRVAADFPKSEDLFSQAEVRVVARDVLVVTLATETREEFVTRETESAIREVVTDSGVQREGVQKTQEPRLVERTVVVGTLAFSADDVPRITETLTTGGQLFVAALSGNASSPDQPHRVPDISGLEPIRAYWQEVGGRVHKVEHIRGSDRNSERWLDGRRFDAK